MFTNIAAYKFVPLSDLKSLRSRLLAQCKASHLKGTILLSTEGINLFVAGSAEAIAELLHELRLLPGLATLEVKESLSQEQPFRRMLVRIKREIIAFGVPEIDPARNPSPKLSPRELRQWLAEGRPITLLDTRNDYEVKLGTFENAVSLGIDHFREFPQAVAKLPAEMKQRPIVMFCTGGIRCEKAGPFMQREGFEQVYQLEGGILRYFEDVGGDHYQGECFVFDQRVGVDAELQETPSTQCYACQMPLSAADQADDRYVPGRSCPCCYRTSSEQQQQTLARRQAAIAAATDPLPGAGPYENQRPLKVSGEYEGRPLLEFLCGVLPHVPRERWQITIAAERLIDCQGHALAADSIVRAGDRLLHRLPETCEPAVNANIELLHEDEAILVVNKPAPLPMHPSGRYNRNTLQHILCLVYKPQAPRPAHRLDANTTGVVVLARTRHFAGLLQPQFARGEVSKVYVARIQGHPTSDTFSCDAPISAEAGEIGSRNIDHDHGLPSHTVFRVLERFGDGTSLVEARPTTGRTNQIRIHLWELGLPIVGDSLYLPNHQLGNTQTHAVDDAPLCLHAQQITFRHPLNKAMVTFTAPRPAWSPQMA